VQARRIVPIPIRKLVLAIAIVLVSATLYGCGSSDENDLAAMAAPCQGDQQSCEALDNARQLRDAADYNTEPELGYVKSPPGMLPMPLTSRNSPLN
jgi:hypothetical protein